MYDITKQIISRNDLGFNILSITNVENILLDSLVVKKNLHINHCYSLRKHCLLQSKAQNNIWQHYEYFSKMYFSKSKVYVAFYKMITKWAFRPSEKPSSNGL